MTGRTLPATVVKNRFGSVLREISRTGGPIVVERDGKPVAVILRIGEYARLQPHYDLSGEQEKLFNEAFGLWADRTDIDENWLADGRSLWESTWADE